MRSNENPETFRLKPRIITDSVIGVPAFITYVASIFPKVRAIVPEPYNYPMHASNFVYSLPIATLASYLTASGLRYRAEQGHSSSLNTVRTLKFGAAVVVGALVNTVVETKLGMGLQDFGNTPDTTDMMYGVAASTLAGVLAFSVETVEPAMPSMEGVDGS